MKMTLGLTFGVAVAMDDQTDLAKCRLWLVRSIGQYNEILSEEGSFALLNRVELPPTSQEPGGYLEGTPAYILSQGFRMLYIASKLGQQLALHPFPGIAANNLRQPGSVCTVVMSYSGEQVFFAVVYSYEQLQQLQADLFPEWPGDLEGIQGTAKLPATSLQSELRVVGNHATFFITSAQLSGVFRINYKVAPEH